MEFYFLSVWKFGQEVWYASGNTKAISAFETKKFHLDVNHHRIIVLLGRTSEIILL